MLFQPGDWVRIRDNQKQNGGVDWLTTPEGHYSLGGCIGRVVKDDTPWLDIEFLVDGQILLFEGMPKSSMERICPTQEEITEWIAASLAK